MTVTDAVPFDQLLLGLPDQSREAWRLGMECALPAAPKPGAWPERVLIVGMGGSAIGADVAARLTSMLSVHSVSVIRDYHLPPLDAGTLVILSSFSGNTEETLAAFKTVAISDATGIAITTGGRLAAEAEAAGVHLVRYEWPGPPRTGFGFGVFVPLAILRRFGVLALSDAEVEAAFVTLERCVERWGPRNPGNEAQELAAWLHGGLPAIIGADLLEVAALRWAGELSENAKQVAAAYGIPEFDHNQLEAAASPASDAGSFRFVILDAPPVHPRNRLRVEQTAAMLDGAGRDVRVVDAGGETMLEAVLAACSLGSWTSYYLSEIRGVDPASQTILDQLKARLAAEQ